MIINRQGRRLSSNAMAAGEANLTLPFPKPPRLHVKLSCGGESQAAIFTADLCLSSNCLSRRASSARQVRGMRRDGLPSENQHRNVLFFFARNGSRKIQKWTGAFSIRIFKGKSVRFRGDNLPASRASCMRRTDLGRRRQELLFDAARCACHTHDLRANRLFDGDRY